MVARLRSPAPAPVCESSLPLPGTARHPAAPRRRKVTRGQAASAAAVLAMWGTITGVQDAIPAADARYMAVPDFLGVTVTICVTVICAALWESRHRERVADRICDHCDSTATESAAAAVAGTADDALTSLYEMLGDRSQLRGHAGGPRALWSVPRRDSL